MAGVKVYFEDVKEGQEIPVFQRKTDLMNWNRYAAVNEEYSYQHMDDDISKSLAPGRRSAIGMGNLRRAYLHNMLRDWIGVTGRIKKVAIQYRGMNFKNDILTCKGRVTKKYVDNGEHLVDLELAVENQEAVNTSPGTATVALPSRERTPR